MAKEDPSPASPCWSNIVKQQPAANPNQNDFTAAADRVFVDSCKSTEGIAVVVVDANSIIQGGERLANSADKFVSVSEVIDEVRDPTSRHRLNFLPFTVETSDPSAEALKKVISFARATGDLQTLSDVDLKLIALTYSLEAQIHGTKHLRDSPSPIHTVNVKRLPEKDLPGWGSNVPNLEEWEALEHEAEDKSNPNSRILPLQDLNLNTIATYHHHGTEDGSMDNDGIRHVENQEDADGSFRKSVRFSPQKKEINIEGKKMVADGIDASQGKFVDDAGDWLPAVSRSTHRKFLRRQARREMYEALSEKDGQQDAVENIESDNLESERFADQLTDKTPVVHPILEERKISEGKTSDENLSTTLNQMRLEEDSLKARHEENEQSNSCAGPESKTSTEEEATSDNNGNIGVEGDEIENIDEGLEHLEISSQNNESFNASYVDDDSSEQSWMLRSLSESSVACVTSDFAMQNVLLQMGLRLLAPGGMQIRQLHRWILKCHACFKVTTEIGRIFCPSCGNGGTLRKVAVTVGENGIVLAAHRPRVSLRGTQFSLPLPKGGRDAITKNPILREDQLPHKFLYPKKKKKNKQGDDIFASDDIFRHHTDKGAPLQPPLRQALAVFSGKRNPNDNHYSRRKR
ncbi:RNA-binding protein [Actinidia chinensis var. chinensis]|uniref:RNA-binding protein n=1 Tax=Actinidia chinensis var. chinensis TaxID=1590841 RepID=A0A2R6Q8C6_ACTCC|nr:RNA-binding protein [Actinidia chinensis var. chinensis]